MKRLLNFIAMTNLEKSYTSCTKTTENTWTKSKTDARQHVLNLTDKGRKIIPTLHDINDEWESRMGLPELDDSFIKILHNLAYKSIDLNSKE